MLATLTACNNETSTTAPEEQQNQTFSGKTTARDGDGDEKEEAAEAEIIVQKDMEAGGGTETDRILCHNPYSWYNGHACVKINNHLYNVSWHISPYQTDPDVGGPWSEWTSTPVSSCNCR